MFATLWDGLAFMIGTHTTEVTVHTILSSVFASHWSECPSCTVSKPEVLQATAIDSIPGLLLGRSNLHSGRVGLARPVPHSKLCNATVYA